MTSPENPETSAARESITRLRASPDPAGLAEALESLATATLEAGDLESAAPALEEAAGLWGGLDDPAREGSCLLLACATRRLLGETNAAAHDLDRAAAVKDLPEGVRRALDVERAEQDLANGDADTAYQRLGEVLANVSREHDAQVHAQLRQRRAAAAVARRRWRDAARELMDAAELFRHHGALDEAEATALGAAAAIANVEPELGEQLWASATITPPVDGTAETRRQMVGGQIAMLGANPALAAQRFDHARQAALDAGDPIAYLFAANEGAGAAEALGDDVTAYTRLATAWVTLGDLLGSEASRQLVRPMLEDLRERLGHDRFASARAAHDAVKVL